MERRLTYTASFDRIGRRRDVAPLVTEVLDDADAGDTFARSVDRYARKYLGSQDVDVLAYEDGTGAILVGGFRRAGTFAWSCQRDDT